LKNILEESAAPSLMASGCISSRGTNNTAHKAVTTMTIVAAMYTDLWLGIVLAISDPSPLANYQYKSEWIGN
jgi:hypothetical protein